jgi:excisionase family DNA binding protein
VVPDLRFSEAELDALADVLADRVRARLGATSPWLKAPEAAAYLACPESRIRKLTMTGELPAHRDGRRVLYRREDLDAFVRNGGALSP